MYFDVATWGYYAALWIRLRIGAAAPRPAGCCNYHLRKRGSNLTVS